MDNFLLGLKLETYYGTSSSSCIDAAVFTIDDGIYLKNNDTLKVSWEDPLLNFTAMLGGNFSESIYYCFRFGQSIYRETAATYASFSGVGDYFLSFLFN